MCVNTKVHTQTAVTPFSHRNKWPATTRNDTQTAEQKRKHTPWDSAHTKLTGRQAWPARSEVPTAVPGGEEVRAGTGQAHEGDSLGAGDALLLHWASSTCGRSLSCALMTGLFRANHTSGEKFQMTATNTTTPSGPGRGRALETTTPPRASFCSEGACSAQGPAENALQKCGQLPSKGMPGQGRRVC